MMMSSLLGQSMTRYPQTGSLDLFKLRAVCLTIVLQWYFYYRFSQPRDHLQWRLVLGYYDKVKLLTKGLLAKLA